MNQLTPKQIVAELDKYIIGQDEAKRAVAVALRNRYRRTQLTDAEREEVTPKNIIMKGPTGVGKTEIARRLAKLVKAPFLKVEATKYTEVGYVGRDVESMIRDLVEVSVRLVKEETFKDVAEKAKNVAVNKVVNALLKKRDETLPASVDKEQLRQEIATGKLDHLTVEVDVADIPKPMELMPGMGASIDLGSIFGGIMPQKTKSRKLTVKEAVEILTAEESERQIDTEAVNAEAVRRAENEGIIFIDEIDKIAGKGGGSGPDVSREGVQRDILPIVEGCNVSTKYGNVKTDYILFFGSGAFHISKVQDLIPELQGRFPVMVELQSLTKDDFVQILTEPKNAITQQYTKLLAVDNIKLNFLPDGITEIAEISFELNNTAEDIGARRLQGVLEVLLEDVSYSVPKDGKEVVVDIDKKFVGKNLSKQTKNFNMKKYIL
jgi:ATP-dependent HslUV protease ATP-binding subunit HslU